MDMEIASPATARITFETDDCGRVVCQPSVADGQPLPDPITFCLNRGGMGALLAIFIACQACNVEVTRISSRRHSDKWVTTPSLP